MADRMEEKVARTLDPWAWDEFNAAESQAVPRQKDSIVKALAALETCHFGELVEALDALLEETTDALRSTFGDGPPGDKLDEVPVVVRARAVLQKVETTHA